MQPGLRNAGLGGQRLEEAVGVRVSETCENALGFKYNSAQMTSGANRLQLARLAVHLTEESSSYQRSVSQRDSYLLGEYEVA